MYPVVRKFLVLPVPKAMKKTAQFQLEQRKIRLFQFPNSVVGYFEHHDNHSFIPIEFDLFTHM